MQLGQNKGPLEKNFLMLQLSTSAFPSGSYTHSSGFEALLEDGTVYDAESLRFYLRTWLLESVARSDGAAVALVHKFIADDALPSLVELSEILTAIKYSKGSLKSSLMVGKATFNSLLDSFSELGKDLDAFVSSDAVQRLELHHALVWGMATRLFGVRIEDAVTSFLFSNFSGVLEVVARLIPLGQKHTQRILANSYPDFLEAMDTSLKTGLDQLASQSAIQDIAVMAHERLPMKLCIT